MRTLRPLATLAVAAVLALLSDTSAVAQAPGPIDPRFRTYGGPFTSGGVAYGHRWSDSDAAITSGVPYTGDYVVVGTLDGRSIGPYAGLDVPEVWRRWTFLRRRGGALDAPLYEGAIRLVGARPGQLYAEEVLRAQLDAERPHLPALIDSFVRTRRTSPSGAFIAEPVVFEVGNEPNVFPYLSPDLYAWYYLAWRKEILAAADGWNQGRAPHERVTAHVMPAGLWMFEGLPDAILRTLAVRVDVLTLRLLPSIETSTRRWYEQFLAAIRSERYAALGSGTHRTTTVTIRIPFLGSFQVPRRTFLPAATADLIDVGALHFYPYTGRHAAYGQGNMAPHLAALRDLAGYVADNSRTRRVWLTEMGNVNPLPDARAAAEVADPILRHLRSGAIPAIDRWYWFKAQGDDDKFRILGGVRGGVGSQLSTILGALDRLRATGLVRVSQSLTPADYAVLDDLTRDYRAQTPAQGLLDASGAMRELGRTFHGLAN